MVNGPQASPDDRREIQRRVEFDQAAALFKLSPQPVIAGIVFSVIVGIVLWPQLGGPLLAGWLALRVLISSTRANSTVRRPTRSTCRDAGADSCS